jgi:hypothetical protein
MSGLKNLKSAFANLQNNALPIGGRFGGTDGNQPPHHPDNSLFDDFEHRPGFGPGIDNDSQTGQSAFENMSSGEYSPSGNADLDTFFISDLSNQNDFNSIYDDLDDYTTIDLTTLDSLFDNLGEGQADVFSDGIPFQQNFEDLTQTQMPTDSLFGIGGDMTQGDVFGPPPFLPNFNNLDQTHFLTDGEFDSTTSLYGIGGTLGTGITDTLMGYHFYLVLKI